MSDTNHVELVPVPNPREREKYLFIIPGGDVPKVEEAMSYKNSACVPIGRGLLLLGIRTRDSVLVHR